MTRRLIKSGVATVLALVLSMPIVAFAQPAVRLVTAPLITPADAWTYYGTSTTHTNGATAWARRPPEVQALARALGAELLADGKISADEYTGRVFQHVLNNVEIEFRFGLSKGARGAIIDQSATAFDQAHLMVELLRQGGVAASYKVGTITLNAQQFGQWTGLVTGLMQATPPALPSFTVNAQAACQLLADGGIPATVNGAMSCASVSGNLTTVTLGHVWVSSGSKLYDPSFKRYNLRTGISLASAMQCGTEAAPTCGSLATTATLTGATQATQGGFATLRNLNATQVFNRMGLFATSLQSHVQTNMPDAPLEEIVGGRLWDATFAPVPATALPYTAQAQYTWSGDIPDRFRTRLRIKYLSIDKMMYADEVSGRRIGFHLGDSFMPIVMQIDTEDAGMEPNWAGTTNSIEWTIDHPYAASSGAYADRSEASGFAPSNMQLIAVMFSLGNTSEGTAQHYSWMERAKPEYMGNGGDVPYYGSGSSVAGAQLLYHESLAVRLVEGVSKTRIAQHHSIGISGGSFYTLQSHLSVVPAAGDTVTRTAAFESMAVVGAMIEGSIVQQTQDVWEASSAVSHFYLKNSRGVTFMDIPAASFAAAVPILQPYYGNAAGYQMFANAGYNLILPLSGTLQDNDFPINGGIYYTQRSGMLAYKGDSLAYLASGLKGGGAAPGVDDPLKLALDSVHPLEEGLRRRGAVSVDLNTANLNLAAPADLVTGAGGFPYALAFQRTYNSGNTFTERLPFNTTFGMWPVELPAVSYYYGSDSNSLPRLGGGWTHNFQITAALTNDGAVGLGADRGIDAVAAIAGVYTITNLARASTFPQRMTSSLVAYWMGGQFLGNVVTVQRSPASSRFTRMANGNFRAPPGSAEQLTQAGARSGPYWAGESQDSVYEPLTTYDYGAITFSYTDADGSVIAFAPTQWHGFFRQNVSFARVARPVFSANSWAFPSGIVVNFTYQSPPANIANKSERRLTGVSNSLNRSLTFTSTGDLITRVTDDTGRFVSFERNCTATYEEAPLSIGPYGCRSFEVVAPDQSRTVYSYGAGGATPYLGSPLRPNLALRAWYTPDDPNTPFVTLEYDDLSRVKSVNYKDGTRSRYFTTGMVGGETFKRGEIVDALDAMTTHWFNADGNLLSTMDALGRVTARTYDQARRLKREIAPEGNYTEYTYDERSNVLTQTQHPKPGSTWMPLTTTYTYVSPSCSSTNAATCNKVASVADHAGRVTNYTYNTRGQLTRIQSPAIGGVRSDTNLCYGLLGGISFMTGKVDVVGGGKPNRVTRYAYNSTNKYVLDNVQVDPTNSLTTACADTPKANGLALTTSFTFDALGSVNTVNGPRTDVTDVVTYTFNSMRRLQQSSGPAGANLIVYDYYPDGSLKTIDRQEIVNGSSVMRRESRSYRPTGELLTLTDPEGNVTRYDYDLVGRQVLLTDPDNRLTATVYDLAGQIRCIWKGWGSATAPPVWTDSSTSCNWNPNDYSTANNDGRLRYVEYGYTLNGERSFVRDAGNNQTDYVYDAHDRLRYTMFPAPSTGNRCTAPATATLAPAPTCPTGAAYEELRYSSSGEPATAASALCSGNGQVCAKRVRGGQLISYTYDARNRLATRAATGLPTITHSYDLLSELSSIVSPASADGAIPAHRTAYDYDDAGRKLFEENTLNGVVRRVTYAFDRAGNRTRTTWPDGYFVSYEYDALNRMSKAWEGAIGTIKLADYSYDTLSRRTQLQYAGQSTNRMDYTYEPDSDLDVLTNVLSAATLTLNYGHNRSGQINSIDASDVFYLPSPAAGSTTAYVSNKLNRYSSVGGEWVAHDDNGNLINWFQNSIKQTYTYDAENRLRTANTNGGTTAMVTYDYDGLGRRISKLVGSTATYFLLDADEEIAEYDASGNVLRRYIMGPAIDDRIAAAEGSSTTNPVKTYYHINHQGSVIAMTDSAGNAVGCAAGVNCQRLSYNEYGMLGAGSSATGQPYRYTGRRFDAETGLYYYRARYYTPVLGRFLQTDPLGYQDDFNLYQYALHDPLNVSDPSGMETGPAYRGIYLLDGGLKSPPPKSPNDNFAQALGTGIGIAGGLTAVGGAVNAVIQLAQGNVVGAALELSPTKRAEAALDAAKAAAAMAKSEGATARMAGAVVTKDGQVFTGLSNKGGAPFATNSKVDKAVTEAKLELGDGAPGWSGSCCEMNAAAQALNKGADVRGASAAAVRIQDGTLQPPCPTCEIALKKLEIQPVRPGM